MKDVDVLEYQGIFEEHENKRDRHTEREKARETDGDKVTCLLLY